MKNKWSAKKATAKLDKLCREVVYERDGHTCRKCGATPATAQLNWCHIFSRSNRAVRHNLLNSMLLCVKCHFWSHQNPLLFAAWVKDELEEYAYSALLGAAQKHILFNPLYAEQLTAKLQMDLDGFKVCNIIAK